MINISINVSLINKDRLFKGKKGSYLDAVMIETPNSEYGDYMIVERTTKQEYEDGVKGTIIGNGRIFIKQDGPEPTKEEKDALPF